MKNKTMFEFKKRDKSPFPDLSKEIEELRDAIFEALRIPQIVKWLSRILGK